MTALNHRFDGPEDAPVLVCSNSIGTTLELWERQVDAFAGPFRLLRYDQVGHGRSEVRPGPYTVELLGRELLAVLDGLGVARFSFCGLSLGGAVGMWLGAKMGRWFTPAFTGVAAFREMLVATPPEGYAACCDALRDWDFRDDLGSVSARTLVLVGSEDPATPTDHAQLIADGIPGARLTVIPDAAHLLNVEQPEAFDAAALGHLTEEEGP